MFKKYLLSLSLLLITNIVSLSADLVRINRPDFMASSRLGEIELYHDEDGFFVVKDDVEHPVQNCFIDKQLRNISSDKLERVLGTVKDIIVNGHLCTFTRTTAQVTQDIVQEQDMVDVSNIVTPEIINQLNESSYLLVTQLSDGSYAIKLQHRLPGGGVWGATFGCWAGKFAASLLCHGAILIVSTVVGAVATPVAGVLLAQSLESTLGAAIETFTTAAAIAGGITAGVVTGPV